MLIVHPVAAVSSLDYVLDPSLLRLVMVVVDLVMLSQTLSLHRSLDSNQQLRPLRLLRLLQQLHQLPMLIRTQQEQETALESNSSLECANLMPIAHLDAVDSSLVFALERLLLRLVMVDVDSVTPSQILSLHRN